MDTTSKWDHEEDERMQTWIQEKHMLNIDKWKDMSVRLKKLKADEAELRRDICAELVDGIEMKKGIATYKGNVEGFDITAKQALGYSLDIAALGVIWDSLSDLEIACIKMEPKIVIGNYKKLPEDSLLHEAVISKMAMPTLLAEAPKNG